MAKLAKRCCTVFLVCAFVYCCRAPGSPTPARMDGRMDTAYCVDTLQMHIASAFGGTSQKKNIRERLTGQGINDWSRLVDAMSPKDSIDGTVDLCVNSVGVIVHGKGISSGWEGWFLTTLSNCIDKPELDKCESFKEGLKGFLENTARRQSNYGFIDEWEWAQLPALRMGDQCVSLVGKQQDWMTVAKALYHMVTDAQLESDKPISYSEVFESLPCRKGFLPDPKDFKTTLLLAPEANEEASAAMKTNVVKAIQGAFMHVKTGLKTPSYADGAGQAAAAAMGMIKIK